MNQHDFDERGLIPNRPPVFTKPDTRPPSLLETMIKALREDEHLTQEEWADALREVPRHVFVPDRAWRRPPDGGNGHAIDRRNDPLGWMAAVYSGDVIVTQINDGHGDLTSGEGRVTSSLSRVTSVLNMLQRLHPYDGDQVLEVGTGVGYTTGLLSHRLGCGNVTSAEVDESLSKQAAANLARFGYTPHLIVGDGASGCPERAPYDRVHVTCGVTTIPYAWVEQTRPGGVIVLPWMADWVGGHTVTLTVQQDRTAIGRFVDSTEYMMMRSQRPQPADLTRLNGTCGQEEASVDPRRIVFAGWGADVAIAGLLPGVSGTYETHDNGRHFRLLAWTSDSQLTVEYGPDFNRPRVRQQGRRDLGREIQEAFFTWVGYGQPTRDRFGITVTSDGTQIWLDRPDRVLTPLTSRATPGPRRDVQ
ncbi:protein-L-isoaspartate(D-aspartate) O-methyltransferase [Actinoallomurus sp. NPDC052274]|uniref:protein-L-isoaspartate(D-aspartate) O-methyltransferase n=1 Tax=Actinoallomurus sp. NPDC052274 TaxID=3155420 RepID=UPI00344A2615